MAENFKEWKKKTKPNQPQVLRFKKKKKNYWKVEILNYILLYDRTKAWYNFFFPLQVKCSFKDTNPNSIGQMWTETFKVITNS